MLITLLNLATSALELTFKFNWLENQIKLNCYLLKGWWPEVFFQVGVSFFGQKMNQKGTFFFQQELHYVFGRFPTLMLFEAVFEV